MIRSIYTVNRSMNVLQTRQDKTSNNIANANTSGFKFQDVMQSTLESKDMINYTGRNHRKQNLGGYIFGNQVDEIYKNFSQGSLSETGKWTDFAIGGNGFFTIQMEDGELAYTRNGNFRLDSENQLVTMDGYHVLGMDEDGQVTNIVIADDKENNINFLISDFEDYQSLNNIGYTNYTSDEGVNLNIVGDIKQGFLEMSNVVMADEMINLIVTSREFEANAKLLHTADETLNKAVNEIGRV